MIVIIILQLIWLFGSEKGAVNLEVLKAGGEENYEKLVNIYKSDKYVEFQGSSIDALKSSIDSPNPTAPAPDNVAPAPDNAAPAPAAVNEISDTQLKDLLANAPIYGNKNANIIMFEFTDIQCPFCSRLHESSALKNIIEASDGNVAKVSKHFPLSFHENAEPAARAAECVKANAGDEAFYKYLEEVFTKKELSETGLLAAASVAGANQTTVKTCLDNGDFKSEVQKQMSQGQQLGVQGTPGTVIINLKTKKFKLVSGAQGQAAFEAAVNELK